jgi:hypothetical protein
LRSKEGKHQNKGGLMRLIHFFLILFATGAVAYFLIRKMEDSDQEAGYEKDERH